MYGNKFKEATKSLMSYCREQMGYDKDPDVHFVKDGNNSNNMLGYTAHYQPEDKIVTIYISNRHPKDALRSLSHELVHHAQNCRGDLQSAKTEEGYAQKDPHMRKMEEEAYLEGNMMFRDWEDSCKEQNTILPSTIGEQKMNNLKNLIKEKILAGLVAEKKMPMGPGPDGKKGTDDDKPAFLDQSKKEPKKDKGKIPPQLEKHVKAKQGNKKDKVEDEDKVDEGLTEGKCPHCDGDAPKSKCNCKGVEEHSELTDIKKNQDSISSLNENRLLNINKELMRRLLK